MNMELVRCHVCVELVTTLRLRGSLVGSLCVSVDKRTVDR